MGGQASGDAMTAVAAFELEPCVVCRRDFACDADVRSIVPTDFGPAHAQGCAPLLEAIEKSESSVGAWESASVADTRALDEWLRRA